MGLAVRAAPLRALRPERFFRAPAVKRHVYSSKNMQPKTLLNVSVKSPDTEACAPWLRLCS